jgi:hypothetical protein
MNNRKVTISIVTVIIVDDRKDRLFIRVIRRCHFFLEVQARVVHNESPDTIAEATELY